MNDNVIDMTVAATEDTTTDAPSDTNPVTDVVASIPPTAIVGTMGTVPNAVPFATIGLNDETLKAVCVLSSALMFAAPAFATQANPTNILALGDMIFNYTKGVSNSTISI